MKQIIITGRDGMLGSAVHRYLESDLGVDFKAYDRVSLDITDLDAVMKASETWGDDAIIINCAGATEPRDDYDAIADVNIIGPHNLAKTERRVVQVSTDCVFSGAAGPYVETDKVDPSDDYGKTKVDGELHAGIHLTVRCSFIGLGQRGLVNWIFSQPIGETIEAYMNHIWTGLYAGTLARHLVSLGLGGLVGVKHVPGPLAYKGDVVRMIAERWRPDLNVIDAYPYRQNRSLHSQGGIKFGGTFWLAMLDEMCKDLGEIRGVHGRFPQWQQLRM